MRIEKDITTLEYSTVNYAWDDLNEIRLLLNNAGYYPDIDVYPDVAYGTQISQVQSSMQRVENTITAINEDVESVFYNGPVTIGTIFTYNDYLRWFYNIQDLFPIANSEKGVWCQMTLTLEDNNPDAQDIDGLDIYIRGDLIG